ncbi:MAG TPA: UvrD-helicase domain-containing protein [Gemmatimonadaceae bacterium]|nr:UvrD-helicase domain-containing protein [Gemmatimonadaceae bacterium]
MRSIDYARSKGKEARQALGNSPTDLLPRLQSHLENTHGVNVIPMRAAQMTGGRAEINADTMTLKYDGSLPDEDLVMLFAHELGHLVLHQRLRDADSPPDPLTASAYGAAGPAAIARYSPRTYEETQAAAFALEFVAPSDDVWTMWQGNDGITTSALAAHFGCDAAVIRAQLAHALHATALGGALPSASRKDVPFTPAQLAAARFTGAPAIVDAGPGTGKTATVVQRIRCLLDEHGASPSDILALTFSNEAAQELSERVAVAFDDDVADKLNVRTFHGFGVEFLHLHGHRLGLSERFELLDDGRQAELVNSLLGTVPCDRIVNLRAPLETAARVVEHINYCKQRLHDVSALGALDVLGVNDDASQFAELFRAYEDRLRQSDQIDMADLIALPIRILESDADVRAQYAMRFPWVIVDEFQDVTRATSRLLRALCGERNPPWVVGDARQSIYQFLGAAPENVTAFARDFENAHVFALDVNYRSSEPVVSAANQLAALLEEPSAGGPSGEAHRERWTAGTRAAPLGRVPVAIAEAATDAAEAEGVAGRVSEWIEGDSVSPGDIAVLCRRHVDVRNVILELSRRGIKAQASGVLTAEGAAGDLAAMLTLADAPAASIPRVAFALGRGRWSTTEINATIGRLLRELRGDDEDGLTQRRGETERRGDVAEEAYQVYEMLNHARDRADGFTALATVLFDHAAYLRRILAMPECAERQMSLVEIVSVLSLATAYRMTHRGTPPRVARIGFAEGLRMRLTKTLPVPLSPRPRVDAVHVMTCHASKGLEFPCVVVVGQTLPDIDTRLEWLPPALRPERSREEAQANALLFVGVTRAKRAVMVSFPRRASAGPRAKDKAVVPLLERWRAAFDVPTAQWTADGVSSSQMRADEVRNIWKVPIQSEVKAGALGESVCPLMTYLETYAQARFPSASRDLYPSFFSAVRRSLKAVVRWVEETQTAASDDDAHAMLSAEWPATKRADHQHAELYRAAAERMVVGFARAFRPMASCGVSDLDSELVLPSSDGLDVRLDLIAQYRQADGTAVVIAFRPESLGRAGSNGDDVVGRLNWSKLAEGERGALALLEHVRPGARPYVFSGRDGRIYEYLWSKSKTSLPTLVAALEARRAAFAHGEFGAEVSRYQCDRCRVRVSCPQWIGALESDR